MADNILGSLGEAVVLLRADGSKLSEDMKKEKEKLEKHLDSISSDLKTVGGGLTVGVTAPILAMGAAAVAAGFKIDDAMDSIRIGTGATGDALKGLEKDFKAVFADVPDDALVVADTLGTLNTRLGITGDGLQDLTKQLLTMSRITKTDVNANVDAATQSFNAWQISTDQQAESLDFVFKVAQSTGASVTDLMQTVTKSQATFKNLNLSFEESVALLGQMNKAGVDSGTAISALNKSVVNFTEAGLEAGPALQKTLKMIQDLGPGSESTSLAMEAFGVKAGPQLAVAITSGRLSIDDLMKSVKGSKETILGAAADTDGFAESLQKLGNKAIIALEPLGTKLIELGERAIPYIEKMGAIVLQLSEYFADLPEPVQLTVIALAALAAAAGPVLYVAGTMIGSYQKVAQAWTLATRSAGLLTTQMPKLASGLSLAAKGASVVGVAFAGWEIGKWIGETSGLTDKIERLAGKMMGLTDAEIDAGMASRKHYEARKNQIQPTEQVTAATADLDRQIAALSRSTGTSTEEAAAFRGQLSKNAPVVDEYTKRIGALTAQFSTDVIKNGTAYADVLKAIGGTSKLTASEVQQFADALDAAYVKLRLLGVTAGPEFEKISRAWIQAQQAIFAQRTSNDPTSILKGLNLPSFELKPPPPPPWAFKMATNPWDILKIVPGVQMGPPPSLMKTFSTNLLSSFTGPNGFTSQLGPTVLQAITGGGSVSDSIGALAGQQLGKTLTASFGGVITKGLGKVMGPAISSLLPGLGALAGPLISKGLGAITGKISSMFGNATKGGREELAKSLGFGDLAALNRDLATLGAEGERLRHIGLNVIGRNDEAGNRRWMEDVKKFYDDIANKKAADLQATADAQDRLQSAIQKYGFTIDELGPKWRQTELNEQAKELILDFTALTASGIDLDTVIGKMGDSIQDFVTIAMRTGSEVPEAMRPMLQRMVEMGTLTDENGELITDLEKSGIKFSMTLSEGFKSITDKLTELIQKITGDLTDGLNGIPSPTIRVGVEYDYGDGVRPNVQPRGGDINPDDLPHLSKGGYADWGRGTLAVLHAQEAVMPIDRLIDLVSSAGPSWGPADIVEAMQAAGMSRPNINFAPVLKGALADEMYDFAQKMWPTFLQVIQDNGTLRNRTAATIGGS